MVTAPTRRAALTIMAGMTLMPAAALASEVVELEWDDLLPKGETAVQRALQGLIDHDNLDLSSQQPASTGVRSEWNGQMVRISGFVVPIATSGTAVTAFILAPFVGACIHVPPPPANQLVFVTTQDPFESEGLYAPVNVTGKIAVSTMSTHLAQVGYALAAESIVPFRG